MFLYRFNIINYKRLDEYYLKSEDLAFSKDYNHYGNLIKIERVADILDSVRMFLNRDIYEETINKR